MDAPHTNGESGIKHVKVPTIIITMNPVTLEVTFNGGDLSYGVVGMMLHEACTQLEIGRRQAAQLKMLEEVNKAREAAALAARIGLGR